MSGSWYRMVGIAEVVLAVSIASGAERDYTFYHIFYPDYPTDPTDPSLSAIRNRRD